MIYNHLTHRIKTHNTKNIRTCTKKNHKSMIMVEYFHTYLSETNGSSSKSIKTIGYLYGKIRKPILMDI